MRAGVSRRVVVVRCVRQLDGCRGWLEVKLGGAVSLDGPGAGMDEAVVMATQQDHVVQRGFAAVDPVLDVVGVAHQGWSGAVREPAVLVASDQRLPDRCGDQALCAADVEDLAIGCRGRPG